MNSVYIDYEAKGRIQAVHLQKTQIRLGRLADAAAKNVEPSTPKRLVALLFLYLSRLKVHKVKRTPIIASKVSVR